MLHPLLCKSIVPSVWVCWLLSIHDITITSVTLQVASEVIDTLDSEGPGLEEISCSSQRIMSFLNPRGFVSIQCWCWMVLQRSGQEVVEVLLRVKDITMEKWHISVPEWSSWERLGYFDFEVTWEHQHSPCHAGSREHAHNPILSLTLILARSWKDTFHKNMLVCHSY